MKLYIAAFAPSNIYTPPPPAVLSFSQKSKQPSNLDSDQVQALRRLNNWQEGSVCDMNTLYLDNTNLQAECQMGTDANLGTIYRLGSISSLNYTGTYECGCASWNPQYCYPECALAEAPNGAVGTPTEGSAIADAHFAATRTMTYLRDELGIDGVGESATGTTVPVYTVVYPSRYREPTPCLNNQPEWKPLSGNTTSAVILCE